MLVAIGDSTFAPRASSAGACARMSAKSPLQQAWPTRTPNASAAKLAQTTITIFIPFCILAFEPLFVPSAARPSFNPAATLCHQQKRSLNDSLKVIVPERGAR